MNKHYGWMSLVVMLPVPLLMGAKGCGGQVSMGTDYAAEAGMSGDAGLGESGRDAGEGGSKASGGTSATGGKASHGGAGMGGAAGTAGKAALCDGFENTDFQDEVTVRYVNDGDKTLYVGRTRTDVCDGGFSFDLRDEAGEPLATGGSGCVSCEALQGSAPGCPTICATGSLVRIEPGGSYDFSWSGTYWVPGNMPLACFGAAGFDSCSKLIQAPPAPYRFVGKAWSDVDCDEVQGCVPCAPGESGSCLLSGLAAATGTSRETEEVLDYPAKKRVELHFD